MTPQWAQLQDLFLHFLSLSLLSIGGGISTAPEMHRYLVTHRHWLSDTSFTESIALAQAAPGPNILFVTVLGWKVAGLAGAVAATAGMMLPSTTLVLMATRWSRQHQYSLGVRAFKVGLAPLTLGLMLATGWLLAQPYLLSPGHRLSTLGLIGLTMLFTLNTRISLVWLVLGGGLLGVLGVV
ncbi:MAG: chromate transporter [Burkholderiaceae bacterium]|nr:chromate transporter [Burkholderiaceae bacterium]